MKKTNPMRISMQYFGEPAPTDPTPIDNPVPAVDPSDPAVDPKPTDPADPAKALTQADIDAAVEAALAKAKQEAENAKDYDKMTPEQKVAYLEAERTAAKLADFARAEITKAELPAECLDFIKGKDEAETTAHIQSFKTMYAAAVQAGVDARFKASGYDPAKGTYTIPGDADTLDTAIAAALNLK